MTPMFPDGENNRLWAHAARPEPVPESSIRLAVLVRAPEGFALHRADRARAVPVPADAAHRARLPSTRQTAARPQTALLKQ